MVAAYSPHEMADMFRDLIRHVEEAAEVSPDDPSLIELKRIVVLRIAELEKGQSADDLKKAVERIGGSRMERSVQLRQDFSSWSAF